MIIVAIVCFMIAVVALSVGMIFAKNKPLQSALFLLTIVALAGLGAVCAANAVSFSGQIVFLVISPLPLALSVVSLSNTKDSLQNAASSENSQKIEAEKSLESDQNLQGETAKNAEKPNKKSGKKKRTQSWNLTECLHGFGALFCSVCLFFAAMYIGLESVFAALAGVAFGLAVAFLKLGLEKKKGWANFLPWALFGIAAGEMLCASLCALAFSFAAKNILFALGAVCLAIFFLLEIFGKESAKKFSHLLICVGFLLIFSSTLF